MARLGIRIKAVPSTIGWDGLALFVSGLGEGSALYNEANGATASWATGFRQAQILADIYDLIQQLYYGMAKMHRANVGRPRPYRRPWRDDDGVKRVGHGAIPIADFDRWYYGEDQAR